MADYQNLCAALIRCESEQEAIAVLKKYSLWDDQTAWKTYGGMDNNWSIINNQQGRPENALVENLVNSADANLINRCLLAGVSPGDPEAPQSISAALQTFYQIGKDRFANLTPTRRTELAEKSCGLVATGSKQRPNFGIFDMGEGQKPTDFEATFLSLASKNKLAIPFVQGKFNQGSTGVLPFCGEQSLKLIISRKNPKLVETGTSAWGFTIIRRLPPTSENGMRTSVAQYLVPDGNIAQFDADGIQVIPGKYPDAYDKNLPWGTYVKLFDYNIGSGLRTNILFDLYNRLSSLLVDPMLPVRIYERRVGFTGNSFETTLSGLRLRLDEDRGKNVENEHPISGVINIPDLGEFKYSIYVLTKNAAKANYTGDDGVIFTVNGQNHGALPRAFFRRKAVGMAYLADSLIVTVDCSEIRAQSVEEIFQSSRDRLKQSGKTREIETNLSRILSENPLLRDLKNKRRKEEIEDQIKDDKIAEDVFKKIVKSSPTLSKVLVHGSRLSDPFASVDKIASQTFHGEPHPTYFRLARPTTSDKRRSCEVDRTARIQFETDAENDYLSRPNYPGKICVVDSNGDPIAFNYTFNPYNGVWTMNLEVPESIAINDQLNLSISLGDESMTSPFEVPLHIIFVAKSRSRQNNSTSSRRSRGNDKGNKDQRNGLSLPPIVEVRKPEWENQTPKFDKHTAMMVIDNGDGGYDFKINMDNLYLLSEIKSDTRLGPLVLENRFKYGLLFTSMALLENSIGSPQDDTEDTDVVEQVRSVTEKLAAVILPIIDSLSELGEELAQAA